MKNARQHSDRAVASKVANEKSPAPVIPTDESEIASLIADLAAPEAGRRLQARKRLVSLRKRPVPNLIEAMSDPQPRVRWEAMKILSLTADPMAAEALVRALEDDDEDVRWLAGMGLVALRQAGLRLLLRALEVRSRSFLLRDGAHHVCYGLAGKGMHELVRPILIALDGPEPQISTPVAAFAVLSKMTT